MKAAAARCSRSRPAACAKRNACFASANHDTKGDAEQPIRLAHHEIADITGMRRQTATRILGRFAERGALSVRYRKFSIRDRELLARYAARHP